MSASDAFYEFWFFRIRLSEFIVSLPLEGIEFEDWNNSTERRKLEINSAKVLTWIYTDRNGEQYLRIKFSKKNKDAQFYKFDDPEDIQIENYSIILLCLLEEALRTASISVEDLENFELISIKFDEDEHLDYFNYLNRDVKDIMQTILEEFIFDMGPIPKFNLEGKADFGILDQSPEFQY